MKKLVYILLILTVFCGLSYADEIYMNDLSILKGKVIQVTDKNVEYSQEGKPFLIVPRDQVFKIKYDNGQVAQIAQVKSIDKLFLKDGSVIECTIVKVTPDAVIYFTDKQSAVPSDNVIKIVYSGGKVLQISEGRKDNGAIEIAVKEKEPEPVIRSGGFLDSYIRLGIQGGVSYVDGNLYRKEESAYSENRSAFILYPAIDDDGNYTYNTRYHWGFDLGLMFPSVKFLQTRAFDITGVKFGLKTTYIFSQIEQQIDDDALPKDANYDGRLLKYRTVNAGPEMNIVFSPRGDFFNMILKLYVLGGYIHDGELTAAPGLREGQQKAGLAVLDKSQYTAEFTGYSGTIGFGLYSVINPAHLTIGFDYFYSYSRIDFDRAVPVYNNSKGSSFHEFGLLIYVGTFI
ncbi:MAG: hypothetical protein V1874_04560 [Spirochaetota bacterium]